MGSYCLKRRTLQILAQNFDFLFFLFGQACLEVYKQSSPDDSESKIQFQRAFANILGDVQSVIDSPHTRKEKREKIVALCENAQDIMKDILERQKNNKVSLYLYPQFNLYFLKIPGSVLKFSFFPCKLEWRNLCFVVVLLAGHNICLA